jgi:SRSO17 transposase
LVSLTLARREVRVTAGLRLFLPETWVGDPTRLERAGVPAEYRSALTKSEIALVELDRLIAAGVRFGTVLADAGYGMGVEFRQAQVLSARGLAWAVASLVVRRSIRATSNSSSPSLGAVIRVNSMSPSVPPSLRRSSQASEIAIARRLRTDP